MSTASKRALSCPTGSGSGSGKALVFDAPVTLRLPLRDAPDAVPARLPLKAIEDGFAFSHRGYVLPMPATSEMSAVFGTAGLLAPGVGLSTGGAFHVEDERGERTALGGACGGFVPLTVASNGTLYVAELDVQRALGAERAMKRQRRSS